MLILFFLKNIRKKSINFLLYKHILEDKYKYFLVKFLINNKIDLFFFIYKIFCKKIFFSKNSFLDVVNLFVQNFFLKKFTKVLTKKRKFTFFLKKHLKNKKI